MYTEYQLWERSKKSIKCKWLVRHMKEYIKMSSLSDMRKFGWKVTRVQVLKKYNAENVKSLGLTWEDNHPLLVWS